MEAVDFLAQNNAALTEIVWTGPANGRFPMRRIDQVLYDLIAHCKRRVLLVTFAAHRVVHLLDHLKSAVARGVELILIFESEAESEGQLTRDACIAFSDLPIGAARIFCWPLAKRERNHAGRPGKLHVKCAVIDDAALIGSANLTDDAFNRNMELGVLIGAKSTVRAIEEHFTELINTGVLKEIDSYTHQP
jgi:phosphatidylserine/phosphatidylglycerophosphate/cardiolipin synthase-like enzyme